MNYRLNLPSQRVVVTLLDSGIQLIKSLDTAGQPWGDYTATDNSKTAPKENSKNIQSTKLVISSVSGSPADREVTAVRAFTLVEMSIVLIIIGLIVGGIVKGKEMMESGKIVAAVQKLKQIEVAYNTFQLKYDEVPGDMNNASDYWPGTVNGDGNGRLTDVNNAHSLTRENRKFFIHLSRAKMLEEYNGTWNLGIGYPKLATDSGKGMTAGGFIRPDRGDFHQLSTSEVAKYCKAALYMNISRPAANGSDYNNNIGTMTVAQAQAIDKKIDDGIARSGRFKAYRALNSTQGNCLDATGGNYLLSNDQPACMGEYILDK